MHCSHTYLITHLKVEVMHPGDISAHEVMTHYWNVVHAVGKIWLGLVICVVVVLLHVTNSFTALYYRFVWCACMCMHICMSVVFVFTMAHQ